jgi:hypothetical protein
VHWHSDRLIKFIDFIVTVTVRCHVLVIRSLFSSDETNPIEKRMSKRTLAKLDTGAGLDPLLEVLVNT